MSKLQNLIADSTSVRAIHQELMRSDKVYGVYNTDSVKKQHEEVFKRFKYINKIGIFSLPIKKYLKSQDAISKYMINKRDEEKWRNIFQKLIFEREHSILLRGANYYTWLPSYIFVDNRSIYEKWKNQYIYSLEALHLIHQYNLLSYWFQFGPEEQLLILCIIDHYKDSILSVFNSIYRASLDNADGPSDKIFTHLDVLAQECTDLYYSLILNKPDKNNFERLLKLDKTIKITEVMKKYQPKQQGMRELDDPFIITLSILSLLKQMETKKRQYNMIIDFPYGGTELGFAFRSFFKLLHRNMKLPEVIHCFYSSKKILRDPSLARKLETAQWLFNFIPKHYHNKIKGLLKQKGRILLYDNNVTTFGTLADVKHFFKKVYNITADSTVAAIYYKNISKYLLGRKSEPLTSDWENILDYKPVSDYITAFNTWGTSRKGRIIERTFLTRNPRI